jgi:hypothetical protein
VDALPVGHESPTGWVNSALIGPLEKGVYGQVSHFRQEVRGDAQVGKYTFRHGYNEGADPPEYFLDFDFYEENVESNVVFERVRGWNLECYQFFEWAIGDKTRAWMMNRPKIVLHQG